MRNCFETPELKAQVHSQKEAWKRKAMAVYQPEKEPYFPYGKRAQIEEVSKLLLILIILTHATAI